MGLTLHMCQDESHTLLHILLSSHSESYQTTLENNIFLFNSKRQLLLTHADLFKLEKTQRKRQRDKHNTAEELEESVG